MILLNKIIIQIWGILLISVLLSSCYIVRKGGYLDKKIVLEHKIKAINKAGVKEKLLLKELQSLILDTIKTKKTDFLLFIHYIKKPNYLDSNFVDASINEMQDLLFNYGYFNAEINYKIKNNKIKKRKGKIINVCKIKYEIDFKDRKTINKVSNEIKDSLLKMIANKVIKLSLVKKGKPLNFNTINLALEKMVNEMKNRGYINFNKNAKVYYYEK